jgi:ABC-type phosphate transport system substrate-binding protein
MRTANKTRAYILGLGVMLSCIAARAQQAVIIGNTGIDVVVVVNKGVAISEISSAELRDIFTGARSRFDDGTRAIPVVLKGGPAHEVFLHKHVGEEPDEFRSRWRKAVFTGQGSMPKEFTSESALLEYVAQTPGAIGYVSRVNEGGSPHVKVLNVSP